MADRYFPNIMPDFVPETSTAHEPGADRTSLMGLLSLDYNSLAALLERQGLDIKETVVVETWGRTGQKVVDFTLYAGTLGTAFLLSKAYQITKNVNDLTLCSEIVKACDLASSDSRDVTFICGRAGVCALGAVVAKSMGNAQLLNYYLSQFKEISLPKNLPDELLYGRAGFLWACLYINKNIGEGTIPHKLMRSVVIDIIEHG